MRILLIRHGESVGNAEGRAQGLNDAPLTEQGHAQAMVLAHRLQREFDVCAVYASPLQRAMQTAAHVSRLCGRPVSVCQDLREYDCGAITGLTLEEVGCKFPELVRSWASSDDWPPIPGEEGREAFLGRVVAAMADIVAGHQPEDTIVVVAHGGTCSAYLSGLLGLDYRKRQPWVFDNASLSSIELADSRPRIHLLNDRCHLDSSQRVDRA